VAECKSDALSEIQAHDIDLPTRGERAPRRQKEVGAHLQLLQASMKKAFIVGADGKKIKILQ